MFNAFRNFSAAMICIAAFAFAAPGHAYVPNVENALLQVHPELSCINGCIIPAQASVALPATAVSFGDWLANIITAVAGIFGVAIATALTNYAIRLAKKAGLENADLLSGQLNKIILNGLNDGAATAAKNLEGQGSIAIKNAAVASAVQYAQSQGATIIKQLGEDPNSQKVIDSLKARIESAIIDPSIPTHPVLDDTVDQAVTKAGTGS